MFDALFYRYISEYKCLLFLNLKYLIYFYNIEKAKSVINLIQPKALMHYHKNKSYTYTIYGTQSGAFRTGGKGGAYPPKIFLSVGEL